MCDVLSTELLDSDVFGSKTNVTLNTPLETYCDDLASVVIQFNEFCLFPNTDLNLGTICDVDNKPESNFIFNEMQTGLLQTLDDLPSLWESSPALNDNKENWVTIETISNLLTVLQLQRLYRFVMSDNAIMLGTDASSVSNPTLHSFVQSNPLNSFFYPVSVPEMNSNTLFAISADSNVRIIGSFVWTSITQKWIRIPELTSPFIIYGINTYFLNGINYILWFGSNSNSNRPYFLYIYSTSSSSSTGITLFDSLLLNNVFLNGQSGCLTVQGEDAIMTVASTTSILDTIIIRSILNINTVKYSLNCPAEAMSFLQVFPWTSTATNCAVFGFATSGATMYAMYSNAENFVKLHFNSSRQYVSYIQEPCTDHLDSSRDGEWVIFDRPESIHSRLVHNGVTITNLTKPFTIPSRYTFFHPASYVDGAYLIFTQIPSREPLLYTAIISRSSATTSFVNLFNFHSDFVLTNDIGSLNVPIEYNPGPLWFFGVFKREIPAGKIYSFSKHNRYKYIFNVSSTNATFNGIPIIVDITLQRHNDYFVLQNAFQVKMFQNGNIQALDENSKIIWQTAMSDMNGSFDKFVVVDKTNPTVTKNGNYLCYWTSSKTFKQCYYPYNSARFTSWGEFNDSRFSNSIDQQSNFCFDNLLPEPTGVTFADDRCACIGGQRLFNNLFINTDTLPASEKALLLDNLPCLMVACSRSRANFDPTNTFRLMENKCQIPLVICTTVIDIQDQASVGNFANLQNCGTASFPLPPYNDNNGTSSFPLPSCTVNEDCPIGSICVDGICEIACRDKVDCGQKGYPNFDCVSGGCIEIQSATGVNQVVTGGLTVGALIGIVFAAVAVILLISLLCWYFLVYKKTHT